MILLQNLLQIFIRLSFSNRTLLLDREGRDPFILFQLGSISFPETSIQAQRKSVRNSSYYFISMYSDKTLMSTRLNKWVFLHDLETFPII